MALLADAHNAAFARIEAATADWLVPTLARLTFAGVLLSYFWASGLTKLGDGVTGLFRLDMGVYVQMFPRVFEAAGYDPGQLGAAYKVVAVAGTWAEFLLPLLILVGLFTRLAALGMIGFILVMSVTDIVGHGADAATIGTWFDRASDSAIMDQRALWIFLLVVLVLRGGGPLALDRFVLGRRDDPL